jgi:hypothetical protein
MFPEKTERTMIEEDPDALNNEWRSILKDTGPQDDGLFAYEEPRRNVYSRSHLNLRDGFFGSTTDPYHDEDYDTQFHDKDPRGWETSQQPWGEYRRHLEANMRRIDFKDDGDYSTTGGGVHPNTLYKNIRSAQNWVKARLKIFDTSYENMHSGGVGVYPHVSNVFKSNVQESTITGDSGEDGMSMTWEDPENRQRLTMHLSNIVHGGSRMWRTDTTTDHKVPVAAYGKLYRQRGLINHENQMRLLEDDTPWSRIEGTRNVPKNLVKLMATVLEDQSGPMDPKTAAQSARLVYHNSALTGHNEEQFRGMRGGETEMSNEKRSRKTTKDIMALLGFIEQDVKFLESRASYSGKQGRRARQELANLYKMGEVLHTLPAHAKLELRNELLLRSAGFGLIPTDSSRMRKHRNQVVVNPKIVQHMDLLVRSTSKPGDVSANREMTEADSEGRLTKTKHFNEPLFVYKSVAKATENLDANRRSAEGTDKGHGVAKGATAGTAANYKGLARTAEKIEQNKRESRGTQSQTDATRNMIYKTQNMGDNDHYETLHNAEIDNRFGDNLYKDRRMGTNMSQKSAARRDMQHEAFNFNDPVSNYSSILRKNGKNLVQSHRI